MLRSQNDISEQIRRWAFVPLSSKFEIPTFRDNILYSHFAAAAAAATRADSSVVSNGWLALKMTCNFTLRAFGIFWLFEWVCNLVLRTSVWSWFFSSSILCFVFCSYHGIHTIHKWWDFTAVQEAKFNSEQKHQKNRQSFGEFVFFPKKKKWFGARFCDVCGAQIWNFVTLQWVVLERVRVSCSLHSSLSFHSSASRMDVNERRGDRVNAKHSLFRNYVV